MIDPRMPVEEVATRLLGSRIRTRIDGAGTAVILTEVEAYGGRDDAASHAANGQTPRNAAMFGPAGTLYVYRSYGIHWCANIATGPEGSGQAVLLRGGNPAEGRAIMAQRRGRSDHLTDGPGKLCQALGITGDQDGTSVETGPVRLIWSDGPAEQVIATPRIGISRNADLPWRFVLVG